MPTQIETDRPYALAAGVGRPVVWFTSTITVKASSPGIGVTEVLMSPGEEPPLHIHKNEDEWLYVLEGAMTFHVGGQNHPRKMKRSFRSRAGSGTPSASKHRKPVFRIMNTSGGFERMFELAPKARKAARALTAFGMDVVGPHPRQAATAAWDRICDS